MVMEPHFEDRLNLLATADFTKNQFTYLNH